MSVVSSNMISKHYCPECDSFDLVKLHRSFVQKRILNSQHELQCKACGEVFKPDVFEQNEPIKVPVFIESLGSVHAAETLEKTDVPAKGKKPRWSYAVASFFLVVGVVSAFMWMPAGLNTESLEVSQADKSIEKPLQQIADDKQSKAVTLALPEVEQAEVIYELASDEAELALSAEVIPALKTSDPEVNTIKEPKLEHDSRLKDGSSLDESSVTKVSVETSPVPKKQAERKQQPSANRSLRQKKIVVESIAQDLNQLFSN